LKFNFNKNQKNVDIFESMWYYIFGSVIQKHYLLFVDNECFQMIKRG